MSNFKTGDKEKESSRNNGEPEERYRSQPEKKSSNSLLKVGRGLNLPNIQTSVKSNKEQFNIAASAQLSARS